METQMFDFVLLVARFPRPALWFGMAVVHCWLRPPMALCVRAAGFPETCGPQVRFHKPRNADVLSVAHKSLALQEASGAHYKLDG